MDKGTEFIVRVNCMTYNQVSYIEDAMNGFCIQQTNFPFLCVIVDDASTDEEPEVIKKYLDDNFDRQDIGLSTPDETDEYIRIYARHKKNKNCYFCVLLLKYNHYSTGKARLTNIAELIRPIKYIAMCEGDDYWTDPQKLQKQVDFLEEHEDYVMSFHDAKIIDTEGNIIAESKIKLYLTEKMCRDWSEFDLMCGYTPPTPTVVYRRDARAKVSREMSNAKNMVNGDTIVASIIGKYGKGKFHNDIQHSVCRVHAGGVWQMKSELYKSINQYKTYTFLQLIHKGNKKVRECMLKRRFRYLKDIIRLYINEGKWGKVCSYYSILCGMLVKSFDLRVMYMTNKDIAHWIKERRKMVSKNEKD